VREGKLVDARKVSLFRSPQGAFAAVFDEGNNPGYRTYVKHASAEVVEKFVEDVYSEIIWA
jgi:hypothetical protein